MFTRLRDSVQAAAWVAISMLASPTAWAQCGAGGDCGSVGTSAGCVDVECCEAVCGIDPFCCNDAWDALCVQAAQNGCDSCGGTPLIVAAFGGSVTLPGGLSITGMDLAAFDPTTGAWSLYFQGANVGLTKTISAATQLPNGDLLISTTSNGSISGMEGGSSYTRNDLLRFSPTALGAGTAGSWSFYFDGSDVGLSSSGLSVNSASVLPDGSIVMGTTSGGDVPGVGAVTAHDLIRFIPTSLGSSTSGSWSFHLDGSDLGLSANGNKLDCASVRHNGSILLSTTGTSAFQGFRAKAELVLFEPTSLGDNTAGALSYYIRDYEMGLDSTVNIRGAFLADISRAPSDARNGGGGDGGGGPPPTGCGSGGECCQEGEGAGCSDVACCQMICDLDPYCCEVRWDQYCVMAATYYCEPCMPGPKVVVTFGSSTTLPGGITVGPCDLAQHDLETGEWTVFFRGANVGLAGFSIGAATVMADGDLLISLTSSSSLAGLSGAPSGTSFTRNDILRFTPTALGEETAGNWSFFFDGSDVGLSSSDTSIRALALLDDGGIVIGCNNGGSLPGVGTFSGHDLVVFDATALGASTAGSFAPYFRGGDVGLSTNGERLDFAFVNADGMLLLSSRSSFSVTGSVSGGRADLLAFFPDSLGDNTTGTFGIFMTASEAGLSGSVDVRGGFVLYPVVPLMPRPGPGDGGDGGGSGGGGGGGDGGGGNGGDGGGDGNGGDGGSNDESGWTELIPSSDSRLIYVSNDGDDTAAKAVKGGRGYYLPSDPEIGPDPLNPVGPIVSYSNPVEAYRKVRGIGWSHETADFKDVYSRTNRETLQSVSEGGWPDWLLFRRGNTFGRVEDPDLGNVNVGDMFQNAIASYMTWSYNPLAENANRYEGGGISGRSVSEPFVVAAWGPPAEARPVFHGGFTVNGRLRDAVISSIDCQPTSDPRYPGNRFGLAFGNPGESAYGAWRNVLVEDCRSQGHGMIAMSGGGPSTNLTIRRSTWTDGWQAGSHNSSPFNGLADGARLTYEECVFDKNGYKENPADATKWTGELSSALAPGGINGTVEPGQGVQATRTWFDRNWYMSGSAGDTLVLRGNIAARTGGGAEQMRSGGVSERNLFLFNHDGVLMGASDDDYGVHDTLMKQNVFLHDDVFLPPGGWGMNNFSQGGRVAVVDNVFAHPHRGANGPGWMYFYQARNYESSARALIDNAYYARIGRGFTTHRSGESLDHPSLTIVGNEIAIGSILGSGFGAISRTAKSSSDTVDGNLYWGDPSASRFTAGYGGHPQNLVSTNRTFLQWQADGYDTGSQMIADWSSFKSAAGWSAPERDIVSYMQSIDPTYVPDEDVRVDYGCAVGRANAPLVRTVVLGTGFGQIAEDANARLAARRFHAAITFLNRARENRRGNWDDRYTADAVSDYIRQGFGKEAIDGPYQATLSDVSNYTPQVP